MGLLNLHSVTSISKWLARTGSSSEVIFFDRAVLRTSGDEIVLLGEAEEARVGHGHAVGGLFRAAVGVAVVAAEVGQRLQVLKTEEKESALRFFGSILQLHCLKKVTAMSWAA